MDVYVFADWHIELILRNILSITSKIDLPLDKDKEKLEA